MLLGESMRLAAEIRKDVHQLEAGARTRRDYGALSRLGACLHYLGRLEAELRAAEWELGGEVPGEEREPGCACVGCLPAPDKRVAAEAVDAVLEAHEVLP